MTASTSSQRPRLRSSLLVLGAEALLAVLTWHCIRAPLQSGNGWAPLIIAGVATVAGSLVCITGRDTEARWRRTLRFLNVLATGLIVLHIIWLWDAFRAYDDSLWQRHPPALDGWETAGAMAVGVLLSYLVARSPSRRTWIALGAVVVAGGGTLGLLAAERHVVAATRESWRLRGWGMQFVDLWPDGTPLEDACRRLDELLERDTTRLKAGCLNDRGDSLREDLGSGLSIHSEFDDWLPEEAGAVLAASEIDAAVQRCPSLYTSLPGNVDACGTSELIRRRPVAWARLRALRAVHRSLWEYPDDGEQECRLVLRMAHAQRLGAQSSADGLLASSAEKWAAACFATRLAVTGAALSPAARTEVEAAAGGDPIALRRALHGERLFALSAISDDLLAAFARDAKVREIMREPPPPRWRRFEPFSRISHLRSIAAALASDELWADWIENAPDPSAERYAWSTRPADPVPFSPRENTVSSTLEALVLLRAVLVADRVASDDGGATVEIPVDPFSDQPLHRRCEPDGTLAVWSVGREGADHGGCATHFRSSERGRDLGFRIAGLCRGHARERPGDSSPRSGVGAP